MKTVNCCWYSGEPNVGDLIGPWLVEKITKSKPVLSRAAGSYCLVGSILGAESNMIHWGTGIINRSCRVDGSNKILAVRGPISREYCLKTIREKNNPGINVFGDPGLVMPRYYCPDVEKKYKLGIIPHYIDKNHLNSLIKKNDYNMSGVKIINVQQKPEEFVDSLLECECTVSSSLHGLIISVAYGIPTRWVRMGNRLYGDDIKFWDFYLSINPDKIDLMSDILSNNIDIPEWDSISIDNDLPDRDSLIEKTNIFKIPDNMVDKLLSVCPLIDQSNNI